MASIEDDSIRRDIEPTEWEEWLWLLYHGFGRRGVDVPDVGGDGNGELAADVGADGLCNETGEHHIRRVEESW